MRETVSMLRRATIKSRIGLVVRAEQAEALVAELNSKVAEIESLYEEDAREVQAIRDDVVALKDENTRLCQDNARLLAEVESLRKHEVVDLSDYEY